MEELTLWEKFKGHMHTINTHKMLVMRHCFKAGLYKQGLLHDLSKYMPVELFAGIKYYQGFRSPNAAQKEAEGYSKAWLHHKGINKHHMEYWIDYSIDPKQGMVGMEMPVKYVVEMFCDRVAACKVYKGEDYKDSSAYEYYLKGRHKYIINEKSDELLKKLLIMLAEKGEDYTFKYIKKKIVKSVV